MQRVRQRTAAAAAALAVGLVLVPAASAHAILVTSEPANGAVVRTTPPTVTLRFNEPVETQFGSVRVYDANGARVDSGRVTRPGGDAVAVVVGRSLPRGTYTVAWRVVSADTHPVHGAFVFSVGAAGANPAGIAARVLRSEATPESISVGFAVVRFVDLALLLLVAGGAVAVAAVVRGEERVRRRLFAVLGALALALVPASLAGIVFQGASAGGFGLWRAAHPDVVRAVIDTRFGQVWLSRAVVAALIAVVAFASLRLPSRAATAARILVPLLGGALVVSVSAAGHADVGSALLFAADVVHVGAGAVWAGGLAFVVGGLLVVGSGARWQLAASTVPRFSVLAVGAVAALLVAGVVNAYLEVRAWRGLWQTTYGVLLLAKIGLVLPLVVLGAYNRRYAVPRLRAQLASALERRRFLYAVSAELAAFAGVLAVTAVLVSEQPARAQVRRSGPYAATAHVGPFELDLVVDPARAGANAVHLYLLGRSGQPAKVAEARVSASLPAQGIGPLRLRASTAGPGHYIVPAAVLAIPGTWRLGFTVRRGEFDEWTAAVNVPIRKD
jgi:copper transport protein